MVSNKIYERWTTSNDTKSPYLHEDNKLRKKKNERRKSKASRSIQFSSEGRHQRKMMFQQPKFQKCEASRLGARTSTWATWGTTIYCKKSTRSCLTDIRHVATLDLDFVFHNLSAVLQSTGLITVLWAFRTTMRPAGCSVISPAAL